MYSSVSVCGKDRRLRWVEAKYVMNVRDEHEHMILILISKAEALPGFWFLQPEDEQIAILIPNS